MYRAGSKTLPVFECVGAWVCGACGWVRGSVSARKHGCGSAWRCRCKRGAGVVTGRSGGHLSRGSQELVAVSKTSTRLMRWAMRPLPAASLPGSWKNPDMTYTRPSAAATSGASPPLAVPEDENPLSWILSWHGPRMLPCVPRRRRVRTGRRLSRQLGGDLGRLSREGRGLAQQRQVSWDRRR